MEYEVEYTDEFGEWWGALTETEQEDVAAMVELLEQKGPQLPHPYSSGINGQSIPICASSVSSMQEGHIECFMPSTRAAWRSC